MVQMGKFLMEVDMFPNFFLAHFIIASILVREDSKDLGEDIILVLVDY